MCVSGDWGVCRSVFVLSTCHDIACAQWCMDSQHNEVYSLRQLSSKYQHLDTEDCPSLIDLENLIDLWHGNPVAKSWGYNKIMR